MLAESEKTKIKDPLRKLKYCKKILNFLICHFCHKLLIEICGN